MTDILTRRLSEHDNDVFWPIRTRALFDHPDNFGMSADDLDAMTSDEHRAMFLSRYLAAESVIVGAWLADG